MQNDFTIRLKLTVAGLVLFASGCSSNPSHKTVISDELMLRQSQGMANLSDKWKKGKQLVIRGNILVREGQSKIDEGNRLIAEGEKIKRESEEGYRNIKD